MVDAQIEILISAQDKISAQLSDIEKTITKFGNENAKVSQRMAESWQKGTNSLLAIGNIAASVDSIFSSLTNLELRLENATERVANANDRLADSQKNLERANKDLTKIQGIYDFVLKNNLKNTEFGLGVIDAYEKALERVEDAKEQEVRATRQQTIAENNLQRAQNQVIGTYIQVGIQSVSLLKSIPELIKNMGFFGLAIGGVTAALGLVAFVMKDNKEVQDTLKQAWEEIKVAIQPVLESLKELIVAIWPLLKPILLLAIELFKGVALIIAEIAIQITRLIELIKDLINWLAKISIGPLRDVNNFLGKIGGGSKGIMGQFKTRAVGDAIIRPNGQIIETDPRDTIIATKNPGGITVYIDNIYGMNPEQVSRALKRELSMKVSI